MHALGEQCVHAHALVRLHQRDHQRMPALAGAQAADQVRAALAIEHGLQHVDRLNRGQLRRSQPLGECACQPLRASGKIGIGKADVAQQVLALLRQVAGNAVAPMHRRCAGFGIGLAIERHELDLRRYAPGVELSP